MERHRVLFAMVLLVIAADLRPGNGCWCRAYDLVRNVQQLRAVAQIDTGFNDLVFGGQGPDAEKCARNRLEQALTRKIAELDAVCTLTAEQKKKLELAGTGDIARIFDRVEELRRRFHLAFDATGVADLSKLDSNTFRMWTSLSEEWFATGSLFEKARQKALSERQQVLLASSALKPLSLPKADPNVALRQIEIPVVMMEVDPKRAPQKDLDLDHFLGRPRKEMPRKVMTKTGTRSVAAREVRPREHFVSVHQFRTSADFFSAIGQKGIENIISRPTVRSQDGMGVSYEIGGVVQNIQFGITALIVSPDRVQLKLAAQVSGDREGLVLNRHGVSPLGSERASLTVQFGQQVVLRCPTPPRATDNQKEINPQPANNSKVQDPAGREIIFVLTPQLVDAQP